MFKIPLLWSIYVFDTLKILPSTLVARCIGGARYLKILHNAQHANVNSDALSPFDVN